MLKLKSAHYAAPIILSCFNFFTDISLSW